jgi:hypothetical protein
MKPEEVVRRARSVINLGCAYKLGKGGFSPAAPVPWSSVGECDCSGFASWAIGVSRQTDNPWYKKQNGGWFETSAIVADCKTPFGFFDLVPWELAEPGMLLVWGDSKAAGKVRQGHVGIITVVRNGEPNSVAHCSSGNFRTFGDAIQETDVSIFRRNGAVVARCAFVI